MSTKPKYDAAAESLYRPRVEIAPMVAQIPALEDTEGYKPVSNRCDAELLEAHYTYGAEVMADMFDRLDKLSNRDDRSKVAPAAENGVAAE